MPKLDYLKIENSSMFSLLKSFILTGTYTMYLPNISILNRVTFAIICVYLILKTHLKFNQPLFLCLHSKILHPSYCYIYKYVILCPLNLTFLIFCTF